MIWSTLSRRWGTCCRGWRSRTSARSCLPSRWCTRRCGEDFLRSKDWGKIILPKFNFLDNDYQLMKFSWMKCFALVKTSKLWSKNYQIFHPFSFYSLLCTWLARTYLELDSSAFFFSRDLVVNSENAKKNFTKFYWAYYSENYLENSKNICKSKVRQRKFCTYLNCEHWDMYIMI